MNTVVLGRAFVALLGSDLYVVYTAGSGLQALRRQTLPSFTKAVYLVHIYVATLNNWT